VKRSDDSGILAARNQSTLWDNDIGGFVEIGAPLM